MQTMRKLTQGILVSGLLSGSFALNVFATAQAQQSAEYQGIRVELLNCEQANGVTKCYLMITDIAENRRCQISTRGTRAFDFNGNEYFADETQLGSSQGSHSTLTFIKDVPVSASATFQSIPPLENLAAFEIQFSGSCYPTFFQFRNVGINSQE